MVFSLSAKGGRGSPHRRQQNGNGGGVIPREKVSRFVFLSALLVLYSAFTLGLILWNSKSSSSSSEPSPIDSGGGGSIHLGSEALGGGEKVASSSPIGEGRIGAGAGEGEAGHGDEGGSTGRHSPGSAGSNKLIGAKGGAEGTMDDQKHGGGGGGFGATGATAPRSGEARPAGAHKVRKEDGPSFLRQGGQGAVEDTGAISGAVQRAVGATPATSPPLGGRF
ncbi:unnamed protein product [Ectocarpus fasciculatus]